MGYSQPFSYSFAYVHDTHVAMNHRYLLRFDQIIDGVDSFMYEDSPCDETWKKQDCFLGVAQVRVGIGAEGNGYYLYTHLLERNCYTLFVGSDYYWCVALLLHSFDKCQERLGCPA